jgi:uncharacterized protein (TIGR02594 family)
MLAAASVTAIALATLDTSHAKPQDEEQAQMKQPRAHPTARRQVKEPRQRGNETRRATRQAEEFLMSARRARRTTKRSGAQRKTDPTPSSFWQPEANHYSGSDTPATPRTTRSRRVERRADLLGVEPTAPNNFPVRSDSASNRPTNTVPHTRRTDVSTTRRAAQTTRASRRGTQAQVTQSPTSAPPNYPVDRPINAAASPSLPQVSRNDGFVAQRTARAPRVRRQEVRAYVARVPRTAPPNFPTGNEGDIERPVRMAARTGAAARDNYAYAYAYVGARRSDLISEARRWIGTNPTSRRTLWCAAFMNFVLERTGRKGTGSNMAWSFASYGRRVSGPQIGAIAILSRGPRGGHVGIVSGIDENGNPILISGNHNNRVDEAPYPRQRVQVYVMPHS